MFLIWRFDLIYFLFYQLGGSRFIFTHQVGKGFFYSPGGGSSCGGSSENFHPQIPHLHPSPGYWISNGAPLIEYRPEYSFQWRVSGVTPLPSLFQGQAKTLWSEVLDETRDPYITFIFECPLPRLWRSRRQPLHDLKQELYFLLPSRRSPEVHLLCKWECAV